MKNTQLCLALVGAVFTLSACSTEASYKVSSELTAPYVTDFDHQKKDDLALTNRLQDEIDQKIPGNKIKVVVNDSNVLLVGQVKLAADKNSAVSICDQFPSTKQVYDYLTVALKPSLNTDSSIAKQAKNRILMQNDVNGEGLSVIAVDNVVYILGTNAGNLKALNRAINEGIYSIGGVKQVVNLEQPGDQDYFSQ